MSYLLNSACRKLADVGRLRVNRVRRALGSGRPAPGFFDDYPRFFSTSVTNASPNRLNERYRACIASNEAIIRGKRILDLASHDGRWSFAAHATGALHVTAIEARDHLVEAAVGAMIEYHLPRDSFRFIRGDIFSELDNFGPNSIDTVFCFGFLYHTLDHLLLLRKIARLNPAHLVLDTTIARDRDRLIRVTVEEVEEEADAVAIPGMRRVISGNPSRSALELMLDSLGWSWSYYDWHQAGIKCWDDLSDYHDGGRITLVVSIPRT
jgi:hypothetical protein